MVERLAGIAADARRGAAAASDAARAFDVREHLRLRAAALWAERDLLDERLRAEEDAAAGVSRLLDELAALGGLSTEEAAALQLQQLAALDLHQERLRALAAEQARAVDKAAAALAEQRDALHRSLLKMRDGPDAESAPRPAPKPAPKPQQGVSPAPKPAAAKPEPKPEPKPTPRWPPAHVPPPEAEGGSDALWHAAFTAACVVMVAKTAIRSVQTSETLAEKQSSLDASAKVLSGSARGLYQVAKFATLIVKPLTVPVVFVPKVTIRGSWRLFRFLFLDAAKHDTPPTGTAADMARELVEERAARPAPAGAQPPLPEGFKSPQVRSRIRPKDQPPPPQVPLFLDRSLPGSPPVALND